MFAFSTVVPQVVVMIALAAAAAWWGESGGDRVLVAGGILMATGGLLTLALRSGFDVEVEPWSPGYDAPICQGPELTD